MQHEKLSEKISKLIAYEKQVLQSLNRFEDKLENITLEALRLSVLNELEMTYNRVMKEVEQERGKIEDNQNLYGTRERVDISSGYVSNDSTSYYTNAHLCDITNQYYHNNDICSMPVETFEKLIKELKTSILQGELDEQLHLTGNNLIYNKLDDSWKREIQLI